MENKYKTDQNIYHTLKLSIQMSMCWLGGVGVLSQPTNQKYMKAGVYNVFILIDISFKYSYSYFYGLVQQLMFGKNQTREVTINYKLKICQLG